MVVHLDLSGRFETQTFKVSTFEDSGPSLNLLVFLDPLLSSLPSERETSLRVLV